MSLNDGCPCTRAPGTRDLALHDGHCCFLELHLTDPYPVWPDLLPCGHDYSACIDRDRKPALFEVTA